MFDTPPRSEYTQVFAKRDPDSAYRQIHIIALYCSEKPWGKLDVKGDPKSTYGNRKRKT